MNGSTGFAKATRHQAYARLAFAGPPKSGKTFSALRVARYLGERIALIDTERGSASKYVGEPEIPDFDVMELEQFSPDAYIAAITLAAKERYPVLIIDSISHAWMGAGGVLEIVDMATRRSKSQNAYTSGWSEATPMHNKLVDAMLQYPGHLIVTVRTKSRYVMETDRNGKQVPKKVGMEWVQRDGMEYEFDVVGELDNEHTMVIHETRCRALDGRVFAQPGEDLAAPLVEWLSIGAPTIPRPVPQPATSRTPPPTGRAASDSVGEKPTADEVNQVWELMRRVYKDEEVVDRLLRTTLQIPMGQEMRFARIKNTMTRAHHTTLKQDAATAYALQLAASDDDVPDYPAPTPPTTEPSVSGEGDSGSDEPALSEEASSVVLVEPEPGMATPEQLDAMKTLAQSVGPDALADTEAMIAHHKEQIPIVVYARVMQRLEARQAATAEEVKA